MEHKIYIPAEVDELLKLPHGRSAKLARKGLFPATILPGGEIRFSDSHIQQILNGNTGSPQATSTQDQETGSEADQ